MNGPKILAEPQPEAKPRRHPDEGVTGIRRSLTGGWQVIVNGKLLNEYVGQGCKLRAIQDAGTNEVV